MTVGQFFAFLTEHPVIISVYFGALPALAIALRLMHGRTGGSLSPWKYVYSVIVYCSAVPGIFMLFFTGYLLLIQRADLLSLNVVVYLLPILSMAMTMFVIGKSVRFADIPGFNRLAGLFGIIVSVFFIIFMLDRLRIFVVFYGSIWIFILIWIALFFVLKYSIGLVSGKMKKKRE